MRNILGILLFAVSLSLAIYNICRHERKEINGPSLTLFFSAFVGLSLLFNLNFTLLGFDSSQLDKKVTEANKAKDEAVEARKLAEKALFQSKEVYALNLLRTGMLPSNDSVKKDRESAREILKSIYGNEYNDKMDEFKNRQMLPYDFKP